MNGEAEDGLRRAREHLGRATLESLEAARALLSASMRASGIHSVAPDGLAGEIGRGLDALISSLRRGEAFALPSALALPLAKALEAEITRWEVRSQTDSDARPVLRAFLGFREVLWEFGVRPQPEPDRSSTSQPPDTTASRPPPSAKPRVQRFDIEG